MASRPSACARSSVPPLEGFGEEHDPIEAVGRLGARLILQQALEDEVTEFLGNARYERIGEPVAHRNGYEPTTVKTTAGRRHTVAQRPIPAGFGRFDAQLRRRELRQSWFLAATAPARRARMLRTGCRWGWGRGAAAAARAPAGATASRVAKATTASSRRRAGAGGGEPPAVDDRGVIDRNMRSQS
jgi:mutator family transposase